jgi:hypothetical protein
LWHIKTPRHDLNVLVPYLRNVHTLNYVSYLASIRTRYRKKSVMGLKQCRICLRLFYLFCYMEKYARNKTVFFSAKDLNININFVVFES